MPGGKKKTKNLCVDFLTFFCFTRFAHALHSSVHIYLEIENLIGLGGFFNNKLDMWVLLKKKGIFIYLLLLLFLDESLFYFSHRLKVQGGRPHPP